MTAAVQASAVGIERMPGHWVLARLGKQVLRPGGKELSEALHAELAIGPGDDVVEYGPGMGATAKQIIAVGPASYTAVDNDDGAAERLARRLPPGTYQLVAASAARTGLPGGCATAVFGEAVLTMQSHAHKERIIGESARLLRSEGRFGLHELCLGSEVSDDLAESIYQDLRAALKVNAKPLRVANWVGLLQAAGLHVEVIHDAPFRLLEPRRVLRDEGLRGSIRFARNLSRDTPARRRVLEMRAAIRKHRDHLAACAMVASKP